MTRRRLGPPRTGREFPVLRFRTDPAPASTAAWFVTAHTATWRRTAMGRDAWPGSTVHAKEMGSLLTACGASAQTWPKFWHLPFPTVLRDVCPDCTTAVYGDRVRSRDPHPPQGA